MIKYELEIVVKPHRRCGKLPAQVEEFPLLLQVMFQILHDHLLQLLLQQIEIWMLRSVKLELHLVKMLARELSVELRDH
jgi:hypothetical protein